MIRKNLYFLVAATLLVMASCRKRADISLPDNLVVFTSTEQGLGSSDTAINVTLKLSRGTNVDIPIVVNMTPTNIAYGTEFKTTPAATSTSLNLVIPMGNNEVSFKIAKVPDVLYDGDEKVSFEIFSSGSPVLIGSGKKFTLNFAELVASNSAYMLQGGGALYPNKVFVDLSANRQTGVLRTNWDLGFYTAAGNDSFRVILNSTVGMMAKQINKTDITTVTAADTVGMGADVAYSGLSPAPNQMAYVDHYSGDITKTAIALVPANATDSKVYIVNRGSGVGSPAPARGWKKIRILRNATGGYTLQHADIASTTFTTIDIAKDDAYFFKYISFDAGAVSVEPQKKKWDIAWTYSGYVTNFGGGEVPYLFQDLVVQNRNVSVAKVLVATKAYEAFAEADLAGVTWNTTQFSIGSDWRRTTPSPAQSYADRYYIIRDGDNNYYKLRFTSLTDGLIRGLPSIEYALVKKG